MNTDKIFAEQIANEYSQKKDSKVVALKKLDQMAKRPANIFGYTFGVICTLILGIGMCFCMGALGDSSLVYMIIGSVVGVLGIIGCSINFTLYKKLLEKGKKQYGSDIIRLANEIAEEK